MVSSKPRNFDVPCCAITSMSYLRFCPILRTAGSSSMRLEFIKCGSHRHLAQAAGPPPPRRSPEPVGMGQRRVAGAHLEARRYRLQPPESANREAHKFGLYRIKRRGFSVKSDNTGLTRHGAPGLELLNVAAASRKPYVSILAATALLSRAAEASPTRRVVVLPPTLTLSRLPASPGSRSGPRASRLPRQRPRLGSIHRTLASVSVASATRRVSEVNSMPLRKATSFRSVRAG
jgi:hypothetical protein